MSDAADAAPAVATWRGLHVTQLIVDYSLELRLHPAGGVRIEAPYFFRRAGRTWGPIDPNGDPTDAAPALSIARSTVADARLAEDGTLLIDFTDGASIEVPRDDGAHERWQFHAPDGTLVVGGPSERISVFRPPGSN